MSFRFPPVFALAVLAAGCTSTRTLHVASQPAAQTSIENDEITLRSQKKHGVTVTVVKSQFADRTTALPELYVTVANGGGRAVTFETFHIQAQSAGNPVQVYDARGFAGRLNFDRKEARALRSRLDAAKTASESTQQARHGESTTSSVPVNSLVSRQVSPMPAPLSIAPRAQPTRPTQLTEMLTTQEIAPGEVIGGMIKLCAEEIVTDAPLRLVVSVADEEHEFWFHVRS